MLRQIVPGTIRQRRRDDRHTEGVPDRPTPDLGGAPAGLAFREEIHS